MTLHAFLDTGYGENGDEALRARLAAGEDTEARVGRFAETALHVATRRRRASAAEILLANGASINARTLGGKTAYVHAIRREFDDVAALLRDGGADTTVTEADELAVAVVSGRLDQARLMLAEKPGLARTGNPEEDRLLADVAGRNATEPVELLIARGADLTARGLDDGTPLHQAAWFGQPENARLLVDAGAPLDSFDGVHESSPLGWAVHGSRYSGDAEARHDAYAELVAMLLDAGSSRRYPNSRKNEERDAYSKRLLHDATPRIAEILRRVLPG